MPERWGTIFECDGKTAIRHRVIEQDKHTACGKRLIYDERSKKPTFHADHDLDKEKFCKKCFPLQRKARPWPK